MSDNRVNPRRRAGRPPAGAREGEKVKDYPQLSIRVPLEMKGKIPERFTSIFKRRLGELNYELKDLSLMDLAKDVPICPPTTEPSWTACPSG